MVESYWNDGIYERIVVFDLYFWKMLFNSGYVVFNGLKCVVNFIENFGFINEDIIYLKLIGYEEDFLNYLKDLKFIGNIKFM